jgi:hypothetical protein
MRKWFPSEFTWRLYVVLQVAALVFSSFIVLVMLVEGEVLKYRSIYEEVEIDLAKVEAKCAHLPDDPNDDRSIFGKWSPPELKVSPRESCFNRETEPRFVGEEFAGIKPNALTTVLILCLLAVGVPFTVVRVPTWLWEGWRHNR